MQYNNIGDDMNGIVLVNKPCGLTSHDVVYRLRKQLQTKKIGHAGTLDPDAEGLLVCAVNQGTRCLKYFEEGLKHYQFGVRFGVLTDTLDHTGQILESPPMPTLPHQFDLTAFEGVYPQTPPAYSAVKVAGKKLYQYAREGQAIPVVEPRLITVHQFNQLSRLSDTFEAEFEVLSSKGLYVRQLALDLAKRYGTVAHTTYIKRLGVGSFKLADATALEAVNEEAVMSLERALAFLPEHRLSEEEATKVKHGVALHLNREEPRLRLMYQSNVYAIYERHESTLYKADVVFPR